MLQLSELEASEIRCRNEVTLAKGESSKLTEALDEAAVANKLLEKKYLESQVRYKRMRRRLESAERASMAQEDELSAAVELDVLNAALRELEAEAVDSWRTVELEPEVAADFDRSRHNMWSPDVQVCYTVEFCPAHKDCVCPNSRRHRDELYLVT